MHYLAVCNVPPTSLAPFSDKTSRMMTSFFCIYTDEMTHICAHESCHIGSRNDLFPLVLCHHPNHCWQILFFYRRVSVYTKSWYNTLDRHKLATILQTTFSNLFSWICFCTHYLFSENDIAHDTENLFSHTHYHNYWWFGGITSQGISSHIIGPVYPEYSWFHTEQLNEN